MVRGADSGKCGDEITMQVSYVVERRNDARDDIVNRRSECSFIYFLFLFP